MTLSKRTQYGLRALICLADAYEHGFLQSRELANREKLPSKFLESILSTLTRAKYLTSKIGTAGGYRLALSPKDILIGDIIARLEGKKLTEEHHRSPQGERPGEMAVRLLQQRLTKALHDVANMPLAALAEQVSQSSGGQMYYI